MLLLLHRREYRYELGESSKYEIRATICENDMIGQAKIESYECLRTVLRSLQICFTNGTNALECLRILTNAVENLTNALLMKQQHDACVAYLHIHIVGVSLCL